MNFAFCTHVTPPFIFHYRPHFFHFALFIFSIPFYAFSAFVKRGIVLLILSTHSIHMLSIDVVAVVVVVVVHQSFFSVLLLTQSRSEKRCGVNDNNPELWRTEPV